jgi:uncharacterized protein YyaL (SSP411 family)
MEHESFEVESTAALLNQWFVPVKLDREERPDIDRIYMNYVQAATGGGGWPMSVWLTPDLHPFVGGTYFPPDNRYGRPGFPAILQRVAQAWRDDRAKIVESSANVMEELRRQSAVTADGPDHIPASVMDSAFQQFRRTYDAKLGGFGGAPAMTRLSTWWRKL